MLDNGESLLDELVQLLHKRTLELSEANPDKVEEILLVIHRVTIVLTEVHEKMMLDCGLTDDDLNQNRELLDKAKEVMEDPMFKVNMPGGDA